MAQYDIFLVCAPKDYVKLPFVVTALMENVWDWNEIHICTPTPIQTGELPIIQHRDNDIVPVSIMKSIGYRPGWVYQQLLKLCQKVTQSEYYFTIDCDTILLRPLRLFNDGHPIWYMGHDQNHRPYYEFSEKMVGVGREYDHTFLADMNLFYRPFLDALLRDHEALFRFVSLFTTEACHPSEADLYMQFVMRDHPAHYKLESLDNVWWGRTFSEPWGVHEISSVIRKYRSTNFQSLGMHSYAN